MKSAEIVHQALVNAVSQDSTMNYETIIEGLMTKGIEIEDIKPRENVFTFKAWIALGRVVRKGQSGVAITTFVPCTKTDKKTGERTSFRKPHTTHVFHVSQTDELTH
jgi:antirestriction protein ArdC